LAVAVGGAADGRHREGQEPQANAHGRPQEQTGGQVAIPLFTDIYTMQGSVVPGSLAPSARHPPKDAPALTKKIGLNVTSVSSLPPAGCEMKPMSMRKSLFDVNGIASSTEAPTSSPLMDLKSWPEITW